jgi:cathepsin B
MVDCNFENYACAGGYLMTTIDYLQVEGVVSSKCKPYKNKSMSCEYHCEDGVTPFEKYYCSVGSLKVVSDHEKIKTELRTNGPLMMGLRVYEDFLNYESGIYKYTTGEIVGGHAMKLVGYGTDAKEGLYWVMQNQWSSDWGENGIIRIKAGEVGIDSIALGCDPDLHQA